MNQETSTADIIQALKRDYPGVPFLALGQTALWDEPMKAVWRLLLDRHYPEAHLTAGVHDTDYFAKTTALIHDDSPYVAMQHDDILTQGLWSAAGEISVLFGSEDFPTRSAYHQYSVPIDRLASASPLGNLAFLSEKTAAWGWRGIVDTRPRPRIAADVSLAEFRKALDSELRWAFDLSLATLAPGCRAAGRQICEWITQWISEIASKDPDCSLSHLYEQLMPRFYRLLLGSEPSNFDTTQSTQLFRFNPSTWHLPRFRFVSLFLDPKSSAVCRRAYDRAVFGGGMYSLESFGPDALPFDIVVPGIGRGTLHVSKSGVKVDLPSTPFEKACEVADLRSLAQVLKAGLGPDVVLIGKAVSLIDMCTAEFLVVFHETASGYTDRTSKMNDSIRSAGVELVLNPIVRLQYPTWDALGTLGNSVAFDLPTHLGVAFGRTRLTAAELSAQWRGVISVQRDGLAAMRKIRTVRSLLKFFEDESNCVTRKESPIAEYDRLKDALREAAESVSALKDYIRVLKDERHNLRHTLDKLQRQSGLQYRKVVRPLKEELAACSDPTRASALRDAIQSAEKARALTFVEGIAHAKAQLRQWTRVIVQLRSELRRSERSPRLARMRSALEEIALQAEMSRLERVRSALMASASLPHTQSRPTAWWIPLVDNSGAWFSAIADGTTARLERL